MFVSPAASRGLDASRPASGGSSSERLLAHDTVMDAGAEFLLERLSAG
jgi:hypothetical protein